MSESILDGRDVSASTRQRIASAVAATRQAGVVPGLATVLVGEHPASLSYIRSKQTACRDAGIFAEDVRLPADITEPNLLETIAELNARTDIHGILVQQPLPPDVDADRVISAVDPGKDVDGFHPVNLGLLLSGRRCFVPCTPLGIVTMLEHAGVSPEGREVVIVGRSLLVGRPLAALLLQRGGRGNATVTVAHSATADLAAVTSRAEILVVAAGRARFVTAEMVREGAVVIDVGINRIDDPSRKRGYRIVGDVDYHGVSAKASLITPVPGGVGPMTVTMLLYNTVQAARGMRSQDPLEVDS